MAHSTTFRRACAAAALGHIALLRVNVSASNASALRLEWRRRRNHGLPARRISRFELPLNSTMGKNLSGLSSSEAIEKRLSRGRAWSRGVLIKSPGS